MSYLASLSSALENSAVIGDYYDERPLETIRVDPLVAWNDLPEDLRRVRWDDELYCDSTQDPTKSWTDLLSECDPKDFESIRNQIRTEIVKYIADNEPARFSLLMNTANDEDAEWVVA